MGYEGYKIWDMGKSSGIWDIGVAIIIFLIQNLYIVIPIIIDIFAGNFNSYLCIVSVHSVTYLDLLGFIRPL